MTPEERAAKCYREMWEGNGTHSTEFVIAGIARAIREAQEEAVEHTLAADSVDGLANRVLDEINNARKWLLNSSEDEPEIKPEIVATYLNLIERVVVNPTAAKA